MNIEAAKALVWQLQQKKTVLTKNKLQVRALKAALLIKEKFVVFYFKFSKLKTVFTHRR